MEKPTGPIRNVPAMNKIAEWALIEMEQWRAKVLVQRGKTGEMLPWIAKARWN